MQMVPESAWRTRKYMHTLDRLGQVVHEERLAVGMSVSQLAGLAGVSTAFVEQLEAAAAPPNLAAVRRILQVLGIKPLMLPGELARR